MFLSPYKIYFPNNLYSIICISVTIHRLLLTPSCICKPFSSPQSQVFFSRHNTLNSDIVIKMKGLTNFIFTFLLKSSFYFTQSMPTRIFFPYKSVMLVSIYLLKLKIKPPVLTQNPQDTLHSLSCVNICTKDPPLMIFFKIILNH